MLLEALQATRQRGRGWKADARFLAALVRPHRKALAVVLALLAAGNLLNLAQPFFLQRLLDGAVLGGRVGLIAPLCGAMAACLAARLAANTAHRWAFTRLSSRILLDLRLRLLRHIHGLSLRWFSATPFGEVLARINRDAAAVQDLAIGSVLALASAAISLGLVLAVMAFYQPLLLLIGASPFPLALLAARLAAPRLRAATHELRDRGAETASFFSETLGNLRAVQALGREQAEARRFVSLHRRAMRSLLSFQMTSQVAGGVAGFLVGMGGVLVALVGGRWAAEGRLPPGVLVAQMAFLGMVYSPLRSLLELYLKLQEGSVSIGRLQEYFALRPEVRSGKTPLPDPFRGEIRFAGVSFSHTPGTPVLSGADFTVRAGSVTALVGPSGIGKTTAIDLLLRFYDPAEGAVLVDGVDLRELPLRAYRRRVALAGQEPWILRGTLFENIAVGRRGATRDEVLAALRWARLEGLLSRLPHGLDSSLGEAGARVSGGERQRIALARAVLRRPRILILDEATSALDGLTEREVRDALSSLRSDGYRLDDLPVTVLLVTHRLPALGFADQILVLDGGRIIESGTHGELYDHGGLYRRMYDALGDPRRPPRLGAGPVT